MDAAPPPRRLRATLAAVLGGMLLAATPAPAAAAAAGARVRDQSHSLRPEQWAEMERQAAAVAAAGAPVLVELRSRDESQDQTIAGAAALMTDERVESTPDAQDGVVVLVSLRPGDSHHGTAAIYAGAALLDGRVPQRELQRVYDEEMAPRLQGGEVAAAVDAALIAVAHDLRFGPPPPSPVEQAASTLTRGLLDPAAVLLLVVTVLWARRVWRRRSRVEDPVVASPELPGDLAPALVGALWRAHVDASLVRATLLDLARRGGLRMERRGTSLWLRCTDPTVARTPWEREVWSALDAAAGRDGWVGGRRLARLLGRPPRHVLEPLRDELRRRGWFERGMDAIRRPLRAVGVAGLALATVTAGAGIAGREPWGWLGFTAAVAAAFVGLSVSSRLPEVTAEGRHAAAAWEGYRRGLIEQIGDPDSVIDWDTHLAYSVALCLERDMSGRLVEDCSAGYAPAWADAGGGDDGFHGFWLAFDGSGDGGGGGGGGGGDGAGAGGGGAGGSF